MKTVIKKLKLGVLLTALAIFSSCSNSATVGSSLGISIIYHTIPTVASTVTKYSEHKISEYFKSSSLCGKGNRITEKKSEKSGSTHKAKPISISVSREATLI